MSSSSLILWTPAAIAPFNPATASFKLVWRVDQYTCNSGVGDVPAGRIHQPMLIATTHPSKIVFHQHLSQDDHLLENETWSRAASGLYKQVGGHRHLNGPQHPQQDSNTSKVTWKLSSLITLCPPSCGNDQPEWDPYPWDPSLWSVTSTVEMYDDNHSFYPYVKSLLHAALARQVTTILSM